MYLKTGEWQFLSGYRGLNSERHYSGDRPNPEITSGVVNSQHILDLNATYAVSPRLNVGVNVPFVNNGFSLLVGQGENRKRRVVRARGLGDIVLTGRYWLMSTDSSRKGNVAAELGLKLPTGKHDLRDDIVDFTGRNVALRPVDQSIQPGDGGLGFLLGLSAVRDVGGATLYFSGTYLFNPRNTNGTQTFFSSLRGPGSTVNSVPDQYLGRIGAIVPVKSVPGLSFSLGGRVEGVPVNDAIGKSDGFRRPGYTLSVEPGLSWSQGGRTWSVTVPVTAYRNVLDNPRTTRREDSTLADYVVLVGFSQTFGGRKERPIRRIPRDEEARAPAPEVGPDATDAPAEVAPETGSAAAPQAAPDAAAPEPGTD